MEPDHMVFFFLSDLFHLANALTVHPCCCNGKTYPFYGWIIFDCIHVRLFLYPFTSVHRWIACFVMIFYWGFILFFHLKHIPVLSFSLTLCIGFCAFDKQSPLPVLKECSRIDVPYHSTVPSFQLSLKPCDCPGSPPFSYWLPVVEGSSQRGGG